MAETFDNLTDHVSTLSAGQKKIFCFVLEPLLFLIQRDYLSVMHRSRLLWWGSTLV